MEKHNTVKDVLSHEFTEIYAYLSQSLSECIKTFLISVQMKFFTPKTLKNNANILHGTLDQIK
jgi:hypothetical protein